MMIVYEIPTRRSHLHTFNKLNGSEKCEPEGCRGKHIRVMLMQQAEKNRALTKGGQLESPLFENEV
jgi:hypothetical protein